MKRKIIVLVLLALTIIIAGRSNTHAPQATKKITPPTTQAAPVKTTAARRPEVDASLILKNLVETHPSPEISRDFFQLVDTGRIFLNYQPLGRNQNALATVLWVNTPTHGEVLTMSFDLAEIVNPNTSREFKQLVIYHEYQHIKAQLDGREPHELAWTVIRRDLLTERHMRQSLDAEMVAYTAEAELAIRLGWQRHLPAICTSYEQGGRRGLKRWLANTYRNNPMYSHLLSELEAYGREP